MEEAVCLDSEYLNELLVIISEESQPVQQLVIGIVDRTEEIREDLMESFIFAAGVYSPGIDQGREEFIEVKGEIIRKFKIVHIFPDMHFFKKGFEGEIAQTADRGYPGYFRDAGVSFFPVKGIHLLLEMRDRVRDAFLDPSLHRAEGLIAFMGSPFFSWL